MPSYVWLGNKKGEGGEQCDLVPSIPISIPINFNLFSELKKNWKICRTTYFDMDIDIFSFFFDFPIDYYQNEFCLVLIKLELVITIWFRLIQHESDVDFSANGYLKSKHTIKKKLQYKLWNYILRKIYSFWTDKHWKM